jgi:CheY-like chemotaxis protein/glycine cleavage system H lipoate-binding protein
MTERGEVLLVDRDRMEAQQYSDVLLNAGHMVSCAFSGKEAIESVQSHAVDVVLSDIGLPDIDGILLTRSIKDICGDMYVVLMGEWPTVEFIKSAMMIGAYDVLSKPVKPDKLCTLVSSVVTARNFRLRKVEIGREAGRAAVRVQDAVFDDQGLWTAAAPDGVVQVGISVQGWTAGGRMIYVTLPDKGRVVRKGDVLFEIVSSEGKIGQIHRMLSPLGGTIVEVNEDFNTELVRTVCNPCAGQCWLTPVVKIKP